MVVAVLIAFICGALVGGAVTITIYDLTNH